jgi:4-diphosphocytidyl-2-C-methyl-D-erythritol kinase
MIVERAPAKINLALHVRARRTDGYHELETLFAFARDGDMVTLTPAATDDFTIDGPFAALLGGGPAADNLVTRARDLFRAAFATPPVGIALTKNLPVASGIGGGSADAAATLRALAHLGGTAIDDPRLLAIAARLGADVPACLRGRTTLGTGRGDDLVELAGLADTPLLLVNPNVAVATAAVFAGWDGIDRGPLPAGDLLARARASRNDLEPAATAIAPVIARVRDLLDTAPGVILSRMSGSGATCFALFDTAAARDRAAATAAGHGWWTLATVLA